MNVIGWSPKGQAFLDELMALCSKHGVFLSTDYSTIEVRSIDDPIRDCEDIEDCTQKRAVGIMPVCPHCGERGPFPPQGFCSKGHRQQ